jgi:hypothetical protein
MPAGDSQAIFRLLMGQNDKNRVFLESTRTNAANEPLDNWGTPYRIEMADDSRYTIRSAGPDKQFGDADDYVFDSQKLNFVETR